MTTRALDASRSAPHEIPSGTASRSRRSGILLGLAVALLIVTTAWYLRGRQGLGQIGRGGTNVRLLLSKVGQLAPDFATVIADGRVVALSDFRGKPVWLSFWGSVTGDPLRKGSTNYPIVNFPTHILIDRNGIVRDIVLAELNEDQIVERPQQILAPADAA